MDMDNKNDNIKEESKKEMDLNNYLDTGGSSLRKINFGLWFLKNRRSFFISLVLFLILLSIALYSNFFFNLYVYVKNRPEELRAIRELSTISVNFGSTKVAESVKAGNPQSFAYGGKYDFINKVKNPNDSFFAFINYCFMDGDKELACSGANILPGEDKYLVILSVDYGFSLGNLSFVIKSTNWQRVDFKRYGDWSSYFRERSNFVVSGEKFDSGSSSGAGLKNVNNLYFNIKNDSPYNYWELPLLIVLFNNNNVIGVNKYTVYEFMSLSDRDVNISWFNSVGTVDHVLIIPELNILDEYNYIKYK